MSPECSLPSSRFGLAYRHRGLGNPSAEDPRPEEARGPMVKVAKLVLDASPSRNWRPNLRPSTLPPVGSHQPVCSLFR
jgi:hypothetical protein